MAGATMLSIGVTTLKGTLTVTLTKLPERQVALLNDVSVIVVHWIAMTAPGADRPGTRFRWVAIVARVSALFPSVQEDGLQGWTLVVRAISRAACATPLFM